jgi:phosphoribosyl 1,2-cyclic phosphate phosphodiesterase
MMLIRILGTAAAEGWPALFCDCPACSQARDRGGKNCRTRSSLQINDDLKIDFPPDSLVHSHRYGLTFHTLRYLLFTHSHYDHLASEQLSYLIPPFALQDKTTSLHIYGSEEVLQTLQGLGDYETYRRPELFNLLTPFQSFEIPPYRVETLKAIHGTENQCLNFIISREGKQFLYASDTGYYQDETWDFLENRGKRVDLVISECTGGPGRIEYGQHMGFPNVQDFRKKAEGIGLADSRTRWIISHFSHGGGMLHEELENLVRPEGFEVAWDGMEIQL